MNPTTPAKGIFLLFLIMATPSYAASSTKISHANTDFYILQDQPFVTISCTIQPDEAMKYLAKIKEKPEKIIETFKLF